MDSVSVALLYTLLPTCVLIVLLSILCVCLYLRHQKSSSETSAQDSEFQAQLEEAKREKQRPRSPFVPKPTPEYSGPTLLGRRLSWFFSDLSNLDLAADMRVMLCDFGWSIVHTLDVDHERVVDETWVGEILELLGYRGIPPAVVAKLLQRPATRRNIIDHLFVTISIEKTSLESDPQTSLLPSSTDVYKDIIAYIKALRGVQFSPSAAKALMKILPRKTDDADDTDWPVENRDKTAELLRRLLWPYRNEKNMQFNKFTNKFCFTPGNAEESLDDFVYGRFLMLASPQKLEFRWPETSDTCFAAEPDIYATAGEDGVLLDEAKLWRKGKVVTMLSEDSTLEN